MPALSRDASPRFLPSLHSSPIAVGMEDKTLDEKKKNSRVEQSVRQLMKMALKAKEGEFLGKEPELLERLATSRGTLRQAAKIVANDQLIEIRRGVNGGFFASRPDARRVTESPALYLRLQGATLNDMVAITGRVVPALVREAVDDSDERGRTQFTALIPTDDVPSTRELLRLERELMGRLAKLSRNRVFEFLIEFSYTFGEVEESVRLYETERRRIEWHVLHKQLLSAIISGDGELAHFFCKRRFCLLRRWLNEKGEPDGET